MTTKDEPKAVSPAKRGDKGTRRHVDSINLSPATLSATEAAAQLGVKAQTLYAYVSRGLLRAVAAGGRERRYPRDDVERLLARSRARRGHGAAAAGALRWGEPVLESAITAISSDALYYRGIPVTALLGGAASFEGVAELLSTGLLGAPGRGWPAPAAAELYDPRAYRRWQDDRRAAAHGPIAAATALPGLMLQTLASQAAAHGGDESSLEETLARGRAMIFNLVGMSPQHSVTGRRAAPQSVARGGMTPERAVTGRRAAPPQSVASALLAASSARRWRAHEVTAGARLCDDALILMADLELSASTFAARVAASTGAGVVPSCVAALATLTGSLHGGAADTAQCFVDALTATSERGGRRDGGLAARIAASCRRGDVPPGFGHRLFPNGDPRTPPLLAGAMALRPDLPVWARLQTVIDVVHAETGVHPSVDIGLAAAAAALELGRGGAFALFAVGRCAGWVAHVVEQRQQAFIIRARARYVGKLPSVGALEARPGPGTI